jgi:hypothetical protein
MYRILVIFLLCTIAAWSQEGRGLGTAAKQSDGWVTASPESAGLVTKPLRDMEAAIRAGEFKKIGNVLLARRGKLVYEGYFEGDVQPARYTVSHQEHYGYSGGNCHRRGKAAWRGYPGA